jgi:hypothetical protein
MKCSRCKPAARALGGARYTVYIMLTLRSDDSDEPSSRSQTALVQTPARASRRLVQLAQDIPLPPSPAVVADAIDRQTAVVRAKISDYYEGSGIEEFKEATREGLSSIASVHAIIILFEYYKLRPIILEDRFAFNLPAISLPFLHTDTYPVMIPDLFLLLTASFWAPFLTWITSSLLIPLAASYFINLTSKAKGRTTHFSKDFDPLIFNVVKALLVFVIFGQDVTFGGLIDLEDVARVNSGIYGGYKGALVGTGIGILTTLYEAVIKK